MIETKTSRTKQPDRDQEDQEQVDALLKLLDQWMADESGYDESAWSVVKTSIEQHRLSDRARFSH